MAKGPRLVFDYEGDGLFRAEKRFHWQCDQDYVVGLKYGMDVFEERSVNSHSHFFAAVTEAWNNLPESQTLQHPSPEHLRKWALIQCHFCSVQHRVFSTKQDALTAAAMQKAADKYSVIDVADNIVTVYTAESQSYKAMGKDRFQQSKEKVLELLAGMIQVTPKQLEKAAQDCSGDLGRDDASHSHQVPFSVDTEPGYLRKDQ